jgi:hypothetical protein
MAPQARDYAAAAANAEQAVKSIKDPELRRVAFQKILEDILASGSSGLRQPGPRARAAAASPQPTPKKAGPQAYVHEMATDGFFKKPKTIAEVKAELENRGHHIPLTSLSGPLQKLCQRRVLRRQRSKGDGKKAVFTYTDW